MLADLLASYATASVDNDSEAFRRANEDADVLIPDAPVPTQTVVEQMAIFYDMVRDRGPRTMTGEYAAAVAGRFVDLRSPLAAYVQLPRSYVILQRINLGLYACSGSCPRPRTGAASPRKYGRSSRDRRPPRSGWPRAPGVRNVPDLSDDGGRLARLRSRQYPHRGDAQGLSRHHHDYQGPKTIPGNERTG